MNNLNVKQAKNFMDIYNQVFKVNDVHAKIVDYVIGAYNTTLLVDIQDKDHLKYFKKIVSRVSAVLEGCPMSFVEEIPDSIYSGIECPNASGYPIDYDEVINELDASESITSFILGKDMFNNLIKADIRKLRHILVGGSSGGGKTTFLNNIISTLLKRTTPEEVQLALMDPTHFEMNIYKDDPHLMCPIVIDPATCTRVLEALKDTMNNRYKTFEQASHFRNIEEYNVWAKKNNHDRMPYVIVVLNEYSMFSAMAKQHSFLLTSLLQKGYACGIHVIISTKKAQSYIVNDIMKANFSTRICFEASSIFDSIDILGEEGAEKIIGGSGTMLIKTPSINNFKQMKINPPFISTNNVYKIVQNSKNINKNYKNNSRIVIENDSITEEMKNAFLDNDSINEDNSARVEFWAYDQNEVNIEKIKNELGIDEADAEKYLKKLYEKGIIIKTNDTNIYQVVIGDE